VEKSKKRGQNEGSIRQRPDGTWEARCCTGRNPNGTLLKRVSFYGKTRQEVSKKMNETLMTIQNNTYIVPSKLTLSSWLDTWLWDYKKPSVKGKTFEGYENIVRNHLKPMLGQYSIQELRPDLVQKLYNEKAKTLSPRMVELIHITLHAALKQAAKLGYIYKNVTESTNLPAKQKKHARALTVDEQNRFIAALKSNRLRTAFLFTLFTGLRVGELAGLRWLDINFENKFFSISQIVTRIKNFEPEIKTKTVLTFGTPKSQESNRVIPLFDELISLLKKHKEEQDIEKQQAGEAYKDIDLVFCSQFGYPFDPRQIDVYFKKAIHEACLQDVTIHTLRHTFATRSIESGVELKVLQELLGHSSITVTADIYSHVLLPKKREAMNKLREVFNNIDMEQT